MHELLSMLFGEGRDLDALQMAMRAASVFLLTLVMLRVSGRRSLGQHRAFDACTTVLLGSVLSRAVVGASPFWSTMAAGAAIVVLHRAVAMAGLRWPRFETWVSGDKRELVGHGRRDRQEMDKALITQRDLAEAVRAKTGDESTPIERAVLERDGRITVKLASRRGREREASQGEPEPSFEARTRQAHAEDGAGCGLQPAGRLKRRQRG